MIVSRTIHKERSSETRARPIPSLLLPPNTPRFFRGAVNVFLLSALVLFASEREAHAYTDPGTGAMIWQTLVAALIGAGFYFRKFLFWFKGKKSAKKIDP
jgi:hypothetical protein